MCLKSSCTGADIDGVMGMAERLLRFTRRRGRGEMRSRYADKRGEGGRREGIWCDFLLKKEVKKKRQKKNFNSTKSYRCSFPEICKSQCPFSMMTCLACIKKIGVKSQHNGQKWRGDPKLCGVILPSPFFAVVWKCPFSFHLSLFFPLSFLPSS